MSKKHENYELLNLIGYGLAKFDNDFVREFGYNTKQELYQFFVSLGVANSIGVIKNRMDLFDYFFPNSRVGWYQKGDAYIHRKVLIDSLFGAYEVKDYADTIKLILKQKYNINIHINSNALTETKFKKMQNTGLEAEIYFLNNYQNIEELKNGICEDARIYGDGYDFFIKTHLRDFLCEVKGVRGNYGGVRLTQNEFLKAKEFEDSYMLVVVFCLDTLPKFKSFINPIANLNFKEKRIVQKENKEYYTNLKIF